MSMKFTPAASTRTKACPLPGAGVGISTSFITSGPPTDSIRMARMRPSRHFRSGSSRGSGLVPRQRADHRGAAGQPARPRAGLAAPVPQLGAAAAVPPFEPGALPRIAVPVRVELPAGPIELAPLALAPFLQRVAVSGVPLLVFEACLGASG